MGSIAGILDVIVSDAEAEAMVTAEHGRNECCKKVPGIKEEEPF